MIIVYLSPVPWKSIAQRPHFFAKYCINNISVDRFIWIEPTPSRFPKLSDIKSRSRRNNSNSIPQPNNLVIIKPSKVIPIEPFNFLFRMINYLSLNKVIIDIKDELKDTDEIVFISGKPSILSHFIENKIKFKKIIYDIMDDFEYFFDGLAAISIKRLLEKSLINSDLTIFSSVALSNKYKNKCKKSIVIKNACDKYFINDLSSKNNALIKKKYITYGYVGSIAKWFDWDFIIKLAKKRPKSIIKIIGPSHVIIPPLPDNVIIEPAIDHKDIADCLLSFDYGLIPFLSNELTSAVDPVKYYEYIAVGLPVISTKFGDMEQRIIDGFAITLEDHFLGKKHKMPEHVFWEDRFDIIRSHIIL
ncbi:glycosyltransferase [Photobacterium kishitanii]|uniref:glycosyltransferase n=1 Tax=Photobacterium kishitanii TaxID=318456 RepID=UPI000D17D061|nr:glycosyltransferase [Photobacterium kishitanii]PSV18357.1 glycosyltransferase [Photobacterium kishitanii]